MSRLAWLFTLYSFESGLSLKVLERQQQRFFQNRNHSFIKKRAPLSRSLSEETLGDRHFSLTASLRVDASKVRDYTRRVWCDGHCSIACSFCRRLRLQSYSPWPLQGLALKSTRTMLRTTAPPACFPLMQRRPSILSCWMNCLKAFAGRSWGRRSLSTASRSGLHARVLPPPESARDDHPKYRLSSHVIRWARRPPFEPACCPGQ